MIGHSISSKSFSRYYGQCAQSGMQGRATPACPQIAAWLDTNSPVERLRSHAPGDVPVDD
jgi:hypothetical protein